MSQKAAIKMLGGLRAETGTQEITRFSTQKTGAMLAYLAYFCDRTHPRETIIELLWPGATPQAGRASLSVALSSLRHQLEPPDTAAGTVLRADRFAVSLNPDAITTDVTAFERELDAAAQTENQTEQRQYLQTAVGLYRGPLLPGHYEDWIPAEQERLAERYLSAVRRLIRHETKARDLNRALDYARQAVTAAPLREETHQDLIRLLIATGQPAAAQQQYHALEALLREELNAAPSSASRKLAQDIEGITLSVPAARSVPPESLPAVPPAPALPDGIVTFLFTDIEKSTALWERYGDAFKSVLATHHDLLRRAFRRHNGHEAKEAGDSFLVVFARPSDALQCAIACQRIAADKLHLPETHGTPPAALRVRMALHTGEAEREGNDYRGLAIHRASRLLSAAHGGQILCSETTASLLSGNLEADTRLLDLGIFRLRDLPQPERLFQVAAPELEPRTFPPPVAEAGYAGNLPLQFTRFFGREEELHRWKNLLTPESAKAGRRLFTLLGPGGTGKTRLAIEAAKQAAPAFAGAVWFVPLADVTDAKDIAAAIADSLRLPHLSGVEPIEQIADALHHQPSLLVLDNFEQIVTEGAAVVQDVMTRVPSLVCLVTSRQKLDIEGEQSFALAPLPVADSDADVSAHSLVHVESVRMFVDRAQHVRPDFQLTDGNAPVLAALCRALEGIPLAIELAAARAQVLTPAQMLTQLANRFDFLVSKRKDRAERHRTLRGAIEWSFRLLSPELQTFFVRLGVFRGGWTLDAAEAVCDEPLALDFLAELQEASLLAAEEVGQGESGEMRFRMLETLREFAESVIAPEEKKAAQVRHREYFLEFARTANTHVTGPEQIAWLERLERDHDNIRAAVRYCDDDPTTHLRLVSSLWKFWEVRGHYREAGAMYAAVLARPDAHTPSQPLATVYNSAANMAYHQGDYAAAEPLYAESLRIARLIAHPKMTAIVLGNLGNIASDRGDFAAARVLYEESLAIKRAEGVSPVNEATTLGNIGNMLQREGNLIEARTYYTDALRLHDSVGNASGRVIVLNAFGVLDTRESKFDTARASFRASLLLCRELGERLWTALSLEGLAHVATLTHQPDDAVTLYHAAMALREAMGTPIEPDEAVLCDADLATLRESLAPDAFAAAANAGRIMNWEDSIAFALETLSAEDL